MSGYFKAIGDDYVEAIEDGKIVKVMASYAQREGLPILRSLSGEIAGKETKKGNREDDYPFLGSNDLKEMLSHKQKNPLEKALVPQFHWQIVHARRKKNMTRKQLAKWTGLSIKEIQMLENGIFPTQDLTALAKLEEVLGISIRKGAEEIGQPMRKIIEGNIRQIDEREEGKEERHFFVDFRKKRNEDKGDVDEVFEDVLGEGDFAGEEIELDDNSKDL